MPQSPLMPRWSQQGVTALIASATKLSRIDGFRCAADLDLTVDDLAVLDEASR